MASPAWVEGAEVVWERADEDFERVNKRLKGSRELATVFAIGDRSLTFKRTFSRRRDATSIREHGCRQAQRENSGVMSTTLLPLLYQTRTLQRLPRAIFRPLTLRSLSHTAPPRSRKPARQNRTGPDAIPFELPADVELTEEESGEPPEPEDGRSTITPTERDAFDRIFQEIASRGNGRQSDPAFDSSTRRRHRGAHPANIIIQEAARDHAGSLDQNFTATDRAEALLRFPPSLRRAAKLALGFNEPLGQHGHGGVGAGLEGGGEKVTERREGDGITLESQFSHDNELRRQEQSRVEQKMSEAKTDFELWDILEAEVFSMVDKLGIGEGQQPSKGKSKKHRRKKNVGSEDSCELSMDVHGPLYPSLLHHALRLFDQGFAKSSPLALSMLPRIKQLGLASYVLGVPTSFYNSLMSILWYRYNNVPAVLGLWDEMHHAGLSYDEHSRRILVSAQESLQPYADGDKGPFVGEILTAAEFGPAVQSRIRNCRMRDGVAVG
ncbi:hypothetical protein QBC33DRAFT_519330 [Phialemonium atrogriseum]|uniref:Mtf2-like C-terminal domain-containing protein n=1 Tax=Phialemonium atrogriseum TaxID=1093897 RepID=A0AAJ0BVD0_9PEZI|nr:uncharacterized protein QBC33DRAFT_519330 [Phialemonium atrogriseum]KAK1762756.1 hypothetical protein QBC33DRAFT_519330 [Phialemonium atrogriseum]